MSTTNTLKPLLDPKVWLLMTPVPSTTNTGSCIVTDPLGLDDEAIYVNSLSSIFMYSHNQDSWAQLPNSGMAGTYGAGFCGTYHASGPTGTASAGSTTTLTTALTFNRDLSGFKIRITGGTGAGQDRIIASNTYGANSLISVTVAFATAPDATSTFTIFSGRWWFFSPSTTAPGLAYYDRATNAWTQRAVTGLPTSFGTDGKLVATFSERATLASGTSTGTNSTTTLNNTGKAWTVNQWCNFQVRITGGTGVGQVRTIATNTATALTISAVWTVTPDATSTYVIEGNDDFLYLLGNNAVTMYRYSIAGNTWTTLAPTTARAAAPGSGMSANWIAEVPDSRWNIENTNLNGRYIYSFRAGGTGTLDIYDIAGGTAGAGAWVSAQAYGNSTETFTTGSGYDPDGQYLYIRKDATHRFFRYDIPNQVFLPLSTNLYPDSTAVIGDKVWTKAYVDGATTLKFLYSLRNNATELHRMLII